MSKTFTTRPGLDFQSILLKLQAYWAGKGAVILQPYDMEVGAGTFHPATTLRSLGPDYHWRAAYVQPSRRPTDGRFGENPNRLQHYYQFQQLQLKQQLFLFLMDFELQHLLHLKNILNQHLTLLLQL